MSRILISMAATLLSVSAMAADVLPAWKGSASRDAIISFVDRVSTPGDDFVEPAQRIAVFDNDGTLWAEQPAYFQLLFAVDRVRQSAESHPEWKDRQPFKGVLEGDMKAALAGGEKALLELVMATHADMTTDQFEQAVRTWVLSARHPKTKVPYTAMVYQPMLEVLDYLRDNGFKTYIVSGGGVEFMRVFAEEVYGVPPEQVIGSSIKTEFEMRDDGPVLMRRPEIDFIDDKAGKPVGIHKFIGQRPLAAFGNSDGDLQMLQWTTAGAGPRLGVIVRHTDAEREWAYDRDSHIGKLDKALDEAPSRGWVVIDIQNDWAQVFPRLTY
ncbi:MAG: haloacid dehalogenase-like hydrolase [Gammaproteobacteria bacterium]|nr:haloacid dehalogenase-like hydrolase [Gammaproteobacteria bacterium]